jgi:hypothetical protein
MVMEAVMVTTAAMVTVKNPAVAVKSLCNPDASKIFRLSIWLTKLSRSILV